MTYLAWSAIALAVLVTALNAWMTWQRLAGASRRPAEPEDLVVHSSGGRSKGEHEVPSALEELDERGYIARKRLQMGCEAAICRIPVGARIVAGRSDLEEPQYAWDYTSVAQAQVALKYARFRTNRREGVVVEEFDSGECLAAEPHGYSRRWKYTANGQMQKF